MRDVRTYEFQEDRSTYVREQLLEDTDGTIAAKDVSEETLSVRFRMYATTGELLLDEELSKVAITGGDYADAGEATSGAAGFVRPTFSAGRVVCRVVLVDAAVADAETPTGDREIVFAEWQSRVKASPQPEE